MDMQWAKHFEPRFYQKSEAEVFDPETDELVLTTSVGYSEQGMKDLDEIGDLVGGGDSEMLSLLRPYYSMVEMGANGNRQAIGSYMHVLPDEDYGDKPIYSIGASLSGGIEPAGYKQGYISRPFGK
ncbi:unnamed protein product [Thelazia callipaeda]|uniref:Peptidase A1 domain-containing protein n=1 Tax=Thelazia callipaeda TaxID=103827 RepID=A0A0N5D4A0_THECL|nr:unnamed protein product [Thelazia callipaeda]